MTRTFDRLWQEEKGSSVVETALVVPIFVVIVFWSFIFYDLVQLRFKVQEASRFAAWEMTAHDLSGYRPGTSPGSSFAVAATMARARTDLLYHSLHSENEYEGSHPRMGVDYTYQGSAIENHEVRLVGALGDGIADSMDGELGGMVSSLMGHIDDGLGWVIEWLNFNQYGLIDAEVSAHLTPRMIPQRLLQEEDGGFYSQRVIEATRYEIYGRTALVADSWTLHFGDDTWPEGGYEDNPYHRQVQRAHMLGIFDKTQLGRVVDGFDALRRAIGDTGGTIPMPHDAHLASMNYTRTDPPADGTRNRLELDVSEASTQKHYHTQPMQEVCSKFTCVYNESEYSNTLRRRGGWYMGCPEPEHEPGRCNWSEP